MMSQIYNFKSMSTRPTKLQPEKLIGYVFGQYPFIFDEFKAILFALGSGFSQDPLNEAQLRYTYENHEDFAVFPTYSTQIIGKNLLDALLECPYMPKDFNPLLLLHAQQRVEFFQSQLKPNTQYLTKLSFHDVIDKQKSYMIVLKGQTFEKETKELAFVNYITFFIRQKGSTGFKGKNPIYKLPRAPETVPSCVVKINTVPNQALTFRLSGDTNPIHVDPSAAKTAKLKQPILHGLCTLSTTIKAISMEILGGKHETIKNYHVRFLGMVIPGDQFQISVWKVNNGSSLIFETKVVSTKSKVLMGQIDLREQAKL